MMSNSPINRIGNLFPANDNNSTNSPVDGNQNSEEWLSDYEGQLAIDAYQTQDSYIIKAPIAGVKPEDVDVTMSGDTITIKGSRRDENEIKQDDYLAQECYWGSFSRSFQLPEGAQTDKSTAILKNGILTLKIPKEAKSQTKSIKIQAE